MSRPVAVAVAVAIPLPVSFAERATFFLPQQPGPDVWEFLSGPMLFVGVMATIVAFLLAVT